MSQAIEEIRDTLTFILNKLQTIDTKLERQEEDIKAYIERGLEPVLKVFRVQLTSSAL